MRRLGRQINALAFLVAAMIVSFAAASFGYTLIEGKINYAVGYAEAANLLPPLPYTTSLMSQDCQGVYRLPLDK